MLAKAMCTEVKREDPGGQYAHMAQALLGQQGSVSRDLHAMLHAAEREPRRASGLRIARVARVFSRYTLNM